MVLPRLLALLLLLPCSLSFLPAPAAFLPPSALSAKAKFGSFDEMLATFEEPVLVDFHALWCGPCQMMSKELSALGDSMQGILKVAKVDTDKYPALSEKYKIDGLPTCILFKDGKPVHKMVGMMTTSQLKLELAPHLDSPTSASQGKPAASEAAPSCPPPTSCPPPPSCPPTTSSEAPPASCPPPSA
ncbi:hypothetical protein TeGR_g7625 [Tetraparma gracilis]|jgi:thioredoxin|uniref:Thioredoxin domain-containing protein n=1 Tax=Tetraparma gracilis TaxID=2962635 RepID=A0ABQ6MRH5_9STRA|nr:hypothetical protein TeGR_g7625 [Tetraparma gracilis]